MPSYPASIDVKFNDGGSAAKAAGLSSSVTGSLNSISGAATKVASASLAMGAAIVAGLSMASKASRDFEQAFTEITTLMDDASIAQWAGAFRKEIIGLSEEVGKSSTDIARGLYEIVSTGFSGAEALDVLRQSSYSAVGGLTSVETAVDGVTGVMTSFASQGIDAQRAADLLFLTVQYGKTRFAELSSSIGTYGASAAAAGIKVEEMLAAQASLTLLNIDVASAATYLANVIKQYTMATEESKQVAASFGIELSTSALQTLGLAGAMNELRDKVGGNIDALGRMFPDIRSYRAAVALATVGNAKFNETLEAMRVGTGTTQRAFRTMFQTSQAQIERLQASWGNLKQTVGSFVNEDLAPMIDSLTKFIQDSRVWVDENKEWVQTWIDVGIEAVKVFGIIGGGALVLKGIIGFVNGIKWAWVAAAGAAAWYNKTVLAGAGGGGPTPVPTTGGGAVRTVIAGAIGYGVGSEAGKAVARAGGAEPGSPEEQRAGTTGGVVGAIGTVAGAEALRRARSARTAAPPVTGGPAATVNGTGGGGVGPAVTYDAAGNPVYTRGGPRPTPQPKPSIGARIGQIGGSLVGGALGGWGGAEAGGAIARGFGAAPGSKAEGYAQTAGGLVGSIGGSIVGSALVAAGAVPTAIAVASAAAIYYAGRDIYALWQGYTEGKAAEHKEENAAKDMKAKMLRDGISEEDAQAVIDGELSPLDAINRAKKAKTYKKPGLRPQPAPTTRAPAQFALGEETSAAQQTAKDEAARKELEDRLKQQQRALQVAEAQAQTEQARLDLARASGGSKQNVAAQTTRFETAQRSAQQQALVVAQTQAKLDGDRTAILLTQQQIEQQNLQLRIDAANQQEREQQNREKAAQDEIQRLQTILGLRRQYAMQTAWDSAQTSPLTTGGHAYMPGGSFGLAGSPWGRDKDAGRGSTRWGHTESLGGAMRAGEVTGGYAPDALRAQIEVQFHVMVDGLQGLNAPTAQQDLAKVINGWLVQARAGGRL